MMLNVIEMENFQWIRSFQRQINHGTSKSLVNILQLQFSFFPQQDLYTKKKKQSWGNS